MEHFGEWVVERRKILKMWTQNHLVFKSKLSLKTISTIEARGDISGQRPATIRLLATALEVSDDDLLAKAEELGVNKMPAELGELRYTPKGALRAELVKQAAIAGKTPAELITEILMQAFNPPAPAEKKKRKGA